MQNDRKFTIRYSNTVRKYVVFLNGSVIRAFKTKGAAINYINRHL